MRREALLLILALAFALALGLSACGKDGAKSTTPVNITGPITQAPCSILVVIAGTLQQVTGDRGATVTTGNVTITFGPDCSSTVTSPAP